MPLKRGDCWPPKGDWLHLHDPDRRTRQFARQDVPQNALPDHGDQVEQIVTFADWQRVRDEMKLEHARFLGNRITLAKLFDPAHGDLNAWYRHHQSRHFRYFRHRR